MHDSLFPRTLALDWGIPFLSGRPHRRTTIDNDDVFNLRIALGLHHDVLDLCADPHLFGNSLAHSVPDDASLSDADSGDGIR